MISTETCGVRPSTCNFESAGDTVEYTLHFVRWYYVVSVSVTCQNVEWPSLNEE